ncbi:TetR/AcrR family transcriptional regulator [Agrobacterium tumefaciens]|uniref:TetR/AcrR family transcriptional regulator n=1 Tax=Agrobacterium tumefaciens TaxID=358 RepID=UPI001572D8E8|nr:TetR/AcrR family transcriptional regulator [Agrobacterium tumefaciens]
MQKARKTTLVKTAPKGSGRGRPRAFDRDAALACAMRMFWIKGYEATSISDLTEVMGVGTTSLYAAFGSKDELYAEALQHYTNSYENLVWGRFREAPTVREAVKAYLYDSAAAMTGSDCDLPHGCMATLGTVGSDGHAELAGLMRSTRAVAFDVLVSRLEKAVALGELPISFDISKLARFLQTVQSGMAIRARDGADRTELQAVAEIAMAGWDGMIASAG